jgi:hypothetical protein
MGGEIVQAAIVRGEAVCFAHHGGARAVAGNDGGHGAFDHIVASKLREHVGIVTKHPTEDVVRGFCVGFDIDQQNQGSSAGIDRASVASDSLEEGLKVQGLKRAARPDIFRVVRHEQRIAYEVHIHLNADETVLESV